MARSRSFSCAHLYEVKDWTQDQNLKEFGPCFSTEGHGHTYVLEAHISGPVDAKTGMILNLRDLDQILKDATDPLNDRHLNFEVEPFKTLQPTTENIAKFLFQNLKEKFKHASVRLEKIKLFETDDLWVECLNS